MLAEGVAIVISILLAFGIEAWWSNRQDLEVLHENLTALRDELHGNLREIQDELSYRQAVVASFEKFFSTFGTENALSPRELDILIENLSWGGRIDISTGALSSVLLTGVFAGIEDGALQRALGALPEMYDNTAEVELLSEEFTLNRFFEYFIANGSLNQAYNAAEGAGRPVLGDRQSDIRYPTTKPRDHSVLLESDEFLGLLTIAYEHRTDVVLYYERLKAAVERAIALIDLQIS